LTWAPGETNSRSFYVPVIDDFVLDGDKVFYVRLSNPTNATIAVGGAVTNVTVVDDELMPIVDNAGGASDVMQKTATLNGQVTAGWPVPSASVFWGETDGITNRLAWSNQIVVGITNGTFAVSITGLVSTATYYYRCRASNAVGVVWAPGSAVFTTLMYEYWIEGVTNGAGGATVSWYGDTGWVYTLRFSSNLMESGVWSVVPGCSNLSGIGGLMSCTDTNCSTCTFRSYRLLAR